MCVCRTTENGQWIVCGWAKRIYEYFMMVLSKKKRLFMVLICVRERFLGVKIYLQELFSFLSSEVCVKIVFREWL